MALPREYSREDCAVARSLEVIGERWSLLIIRDAFYGVSRFSDFRDHLAVPPAVLTERLKLLVEHAILTRTVAVSGRDEYSLTEKGQKLWPTVWSLISWGNKYYVPEGLTRSFTHAGCGGVIASDGLCGTCGELPTPGDLVLQPRARPSSGRSAGKTDAVTRVLSEPHRLCEPITGSPASP